MTRYCGRDFSAAEMTLIRHLIADHPEYHRAALSQHVCRMLHWYKADGGLKEMSCRVAMLRMHADDVIELPSARRAKSPLRSMVFTAATAPPLPIRPPAPHLGPLVLRKVERSQSRLWNEYIARYHYLGYASPSDSGTVKAVGIIKNENKIRRGECHESNHENSNSSSSNDGNRSPGICSPYLF